MAALLLHRDAERLRLLAAGVCDLDLRHRLLAIAARLDAQAKAEEVPFEEIPSYSHMPRADHAN
jgi:hypothetical protein